MIKAEKQTAAQMQEMSSEHPDASAFHHMTNGTSQIWNSRIGWRITFVVFMTIVLVYSGVVFFTISDFRSTKIQNMEDLGKAIISPLLDTPRNGTTDDASTEASPLTNEEVIRLVGSSKVMGLSLYTDNLKFIKNYGQPVSLVADDFGMLSLTKMADEGQAYEFILTPGDLIAPYYASIKMDAHDLSRSINLLIVQHVLIAFILSALVTNVLMLTLGRWLLSPILTLRQNLISATQNPENPYIHELNIDPDSEIGGALKAAKQLIKQNAHNLKEIKTEAESEIHKLAYYDSLTDLPNRELFLKLLRERAKERVDLKEALRFGVIAMDLDHFKDINDSMGHHVGDIILKEVGKRLSMTLPKQAVVSRYGEDEFAIMVPLHNDSKTHDVATELASIIRSEPFKAFDEDFQIRCSIGLATFPDDSSDPDHILKGADIALNRAKEDGRDTIRAYSHDFDIAVKERFQTLRDLRVAMVEDQLRLFYQPQFDLKTGEMIGVECLIRWWKPDDSPAGGRLVAPDAFIPIAEKSGLIIPMGEWIIRHACERGVAWQKLGLPKIRIAVNVSGAQFADGDIPAYVAKVLKETGFDAECLEIEVTESLFMEDIDHTIAALHELHKLGVELAIDDFGTGYSSLSYLRQFPIDRLKIDRSFVDSAVTDSDDAAIARTIIALGHSLNLEVIAEGVETLEQQEFLIDEGCDLVQGYRYARPQPEDELIDFVKSYTGSLDQFDKK